MWTIFFLGGEAEHYFLGMGRMQSLSSQGGMVCRESTIFWGGQIFKRTADKIRPY